ncbi:hypothetical protein CYMTET_24942 [Cymbomonas tetramitiformis]|uniref:CBS domain-containing protein n=1 Tax=Cymbomonas tetramitiformis TaxID=36881 RepID=A0AAE0KZE3_9CHLO|nr:hypothetical protein CYMTET_24942 [Cymbomonas tetramitiformis]
MSEGGYLPHANSADFLFLNENCTIGEALDQLAAYNVLSAPVVRGVTGTAVDLAQENKLQYTVLGCLDVDKLLEALLLTIEKKNVDLFSMASGPLTYQQTNTLMLAINECAQDFFLHAITTLPASLDGGSLFRGDLGTNLLAVIDDAFLFPANKSISNHRVLVFGIRGEVVNTLSQSDILRYIYHFKSEIKELTSQTVQELGLATSPVSTIPANIPAIMGFKTMHTRRVSGIAVVDAQDGRLVGNLSVSDIRGLSPAIFGCLAMPTIEFLNRALNDEALLHARLQAAKDESIGAKLSPSSPGLAATSGLSRKTVAPIMCTGSTTLGEVMRNLVQHKVHRIYQVDEHLRPIGVITITNVIWLLAGKEWRKLVPGYDTPTPMRPDVNMSPAVS